MNNTDKSQVEGRRDSRRIANDMLIEAIRALWCGVPEQRFGQLMMNLSRIEGGFADTWEWSNAEWRERIEEAMRTWAAL